MDDLLSNIGTLIQRSGLDDKGIKDALRRVVDQNWPKKMLPWSNIDRPIIEEVQKASVGSAGVLTFKDARGIQVVMLEAGDHYDFMKKDKSETHYMVSGGFINLAKPESPTEGAAREIREELCSDKGPLLDIKSDRLRPVNSMTIVSPNDPKARNVLMGHIVELDQKEVGTVKEHIEKLASDQAYKAGVMKQTAHGEKSEVSGVKIFPLKDLAAGKVKLLHNDQYTLFKNIEQHFAERDKGIV